MSYCRWSTDDFTSDVYVYHSVHGHWQTHVATTHLQWLVELPPPVEPLPAGSDGEAITEWTSRWVERSRRVSKMTEDDTSCRWVDLPEIPQHDFQHDTPGECADNLEHLRSLGFTVPQGAIDDLREEATA